MLYQLSYRGLWHPACSVSTRIGGIVDRNDHRTTLEMTVHLSTCTLPLAGTGCVRPRMTRVLAESESWCQTHRRLTAAAADGAEELQFSSCVSLSPSEGNVRFSRGMPFYIAQLANGVIRSLFPFVSSPFCGLRSVPVHRPKQFLSRKISPDPQTSRKPLPFPESPGLFFCAVPVALDRSVMLPQPVLCSNRWPK